MGFRFRETRERVQLEPRNIEIDGTAVKSPDQIREVLDMTFPEIDTVTDAHGQPVMITVETNWETLIPVRINH